MRCRMTKRYPLIDFCPSIPKWRHSRKPHNFLPTCVKGRRKASRRILPNSRYLLPSEPLYASANNATPSNRSDTAVRSSGSSGIAYLTPVSPLCAANIPRLLSRRSRSSSVSHSKATHGIGDKIEREHPWKVEMMLHRDFNSEFAPFSFILRNNDPLRSVSNRGFCQRQCSSH